MDTERTIEDQTPDSPAEETTTGTDVQDTEDQGADNATLDAASTDEDPAESRLGL